ncbi:MAG: DUF1292 domain-containing protein [Lachnospiraceae bacterium]|nr:DUF1292 domain-containing protein [Lachnospiraceae bacterium]
MTESGKITLTADDGSEEVFFVLEKAEITGGSYLLVTDGLEEDAQALILKEVEDAETVAYEVVTEERELRILSSYFEELLDDEVEIRLE